MIIGAVALSSLLMEPQQTETLVPILWHFLGAMLLSATAVLALTLRSAASPLLRPAPAPAPDGVAPP